ncbi:protein of unknown function DUF574 [Parafrankia sp. EUN1f]|nr:protein of unknown function DUF574 [Parafrankia sp. EUN1f]
MPHVARIYDYYLGGKDNFPADRQAAEKTLEVFPDAPTAARQNRAFVHRATRYLVAEAGIRQFLDVGTGIPTRPNLHEIAQGIAPESRVVYADNDPIVLAHARALLTSTPEGKTAYLDADLREPEKILASVEIAETLDLDQPIALSLIAILHFIPDSDDPYGIIRRYVSVLPSGSYLALTHGTADFTVEVSAAQEVYRSRGISGTARSRQEVEQFFDGLEIVTPGVAVVHRWRPDAPFGDSLNDAQVSVYGAIARVL